MVNLLILLGYTSKIILSKLGEGYVEKVAKFLVEVVYYFLIPVAFFYNYSVKDLSARDLGLIGAYTMFIIVALPLVYLAKRIKQLNLGDIEIKSLLLVAMFPNFVFLGFPVTLSIFGTISVASVLGLYSIVLNVLVPELLSSRKPSFTGLLKIPALYGFGAGVFVHYVSLQVLKPLIETLSITPMLLSYVATFTLGLRLGFVSSKISELAKFTLATSIFRFVVSPITAAVYSSALPILEPTEELQLIVLFSMPPAVLNTVIADRLGWRTELVSSSTFILTIFYVIAIYPLQYALFG